MPNTAPAPRGPATRAIEVRALFLAAQVPGVQDLPLTADLEVGP